MRFGSVCSGIEAASVAWSPLGWEAAWFAEIEPFPSAVLAHHYPHVPNLGDMTTIARRVLSGEVEAPDLLCGGTPCQAFSVAGLRKSLDDDRGNLTLKFVELADAIDHVRARAGLDPADIFWENVPGVLSTKDNAFGCFLAGLAGEDEPLVSPRPPDAQGRRTWSNAGCVYGPKRAIAWRTLDAQYFGLAQRRRRVFVVASAGDRFDPATVLFEWDGLRRDTPPSRKAGEEVAGRAGPGSASGSRHNSHWNGGVHPPLSQASQTRAGGIGGSNQEIFEQGGAGLVPGVAPTLDASFGRLQGCSGQDANHGHGHLVTAFGGNRTSGSIDISPALLAQPGSGYKGDFESETFLVQETAHTLRGEGFDASEDGTGRGTPLVPVVAGTLGANHGNIKAEHAWTGQLVAFDTTQVTSATNRSNPQPGDPCHPLAAGAHPPAIAIGSQHAHAEETGPIEALRALREAVGAEAFQQWCAGVAVSLQPAQVLRHDLHGAGIRCEADEGRRRLDDGALPRAEDGAAWPMRQVWEAGRQRRAPQGRELPEQLARQLGEALSQLPHEGAQPAWLLQCLRGTGQGAGVLQPALPSVQGGAPALQVRRLTPVEAERLQGFPDNYTAIPWRGKPASECPDGPRYKALGNSWATNVVNWLGRRLAKAKGLEVVA